MDGDEIEGALEESADANRELAEAEEHIADAIEGQTDAAVEIARIQADRDTQIEAIRAEAGIESARLFAENEAARLELLQCQTELETARADLLAARLEVERLTPPPSTEAPPNPTPEPEPANVAPISPESQEPTQAPPVQEPPKAAKRKHNWI
jgi:hypothetical protein